MSAYNRAEHVNTVEAGYFTKGNKNSPKCWIFCTIKSITSEKNFIPHPHVTCVETFASLKKIRIYSFPFSYI